MQSNKIKNWLSQTNSAFFSAYVMFAAFCTYSCMYAFRKPFAAATFEGFTLFEQDYKVILATAQLIGYALSKFIGIKVISEMSGRGRAFSILILIAVAELALILFGIIPPPYNFILLFFNGLPLGMVWGLVFSYIEGRKLTEILSAGLCASFIFASGFVKTIGSMVMQDWGVSEFWMPAVTGALFAIPLLLTVGMLDQIPPPTAEDEKLRSKRAPMDGAARRKFLKTFAPGIILLVIVYVMLTVFRDLRDNFAAEIWEELGITDTTIFALSETPIAIGILLIIALVFVVKDNMKALIVNHLLVTVGFIMLGVSTLLFEAGLMSPLAWMIMAGFGLYMGYVPFNAVLFDRLLAAFRYVGTAGFLIYVADSAGYAGVIVNYFYKLLAQPDLSWLRFFKISSYVVSVIGTVLTLAAMFYFMAKRRQMLKEEK